MKVSLHLVREGGVVAAALPLLQGGRQLLRRPSQDLEGAGGGVAVAALVSLSWEEALCQASREDRRWVRLQDFD